MAAMQRAGGPTSSRQSAGMAGTAVLLLWAQALGLAGAQLSQLTAEPPWTPVFQSEMVTLTCWGSGMTRTTSWYINEQLWMQAGPHYLHITKDHPGTYQCRGPSTGVSPPVTVSFSNDWLVLQVPTRVLLEGDELPLRCRGWEGAAVAQVQFFHEQRALGGPTRGTELLLKPLRLQHGGRYHCQAKVEFSLVWLQHKSALVTVTVQELFSVPVLHLEGPAEPPEGHPLALGCLSTPSTLRPPPRLQHLFYRDGVVVGGPQDSPQLRLPALELTHSGKYSCEVRTATASVQKRSAPVTITVRRIPVSGVSLKAQPPKGEVVEGDRLVLLCSVATGTGPLSFSWHRQGSAALLATGPRYELSAAQQQDSGRYHCMANNGGTAASSPSLWVTVLVPVAGATITMARTEPSVAVGESLNLSCSVQAGTAPVTFTWLQDGREVGSGPVLPLGTVGPAHAGTYQCRATNGFGSQRVFQVLSPAVALSVTQPVSAVAVGVSVSILLLLLLGVAVGWHLCQRHRAAAGKSRGRDPTAPPEPPGCPLEPTAPPEALEDGEVLYTHVVVTEWGGGTGPARPPQGSPRPAPPPEPTVTYAVLPRPHARRRVPSDTYENVP